MSTLNKSSFERAKKYSRFGKYSMDDFKKEIRKDFKKRIKDFRHERMDRNRSSLNIDIKEDFEEIKNYLSTDEPIDQYMDQNELFNLLDDIQREILQEEQVEAERHEEELQQAINHIVDSSSSTCSVCEQSMEAFTTSVICDNCAKHFDATFKPN